MIYYVLLFAVLFTVLLMATIFDILADRKSDKKNSLIDPLMVMHYNEISNHLHYNSLNTDDL